MLPGKAGWEAAFGQRSTGLYSTPGTPETVTRGKHQPTIPRLALCFSDLPGLRTQHAMPPPPGMCVFSVRLCTWLCVHGGDTAGKLGASICREGGCCFLTRTALGSPVKKLGFLSIRQEPVSLARKRYSGGPAGLSPLGSTSSFPWTCFLSVPHKYLEVREKVALRMIVPGPVQTCHL